MSAMKNSKSMVCILLLLFIFNVNSVSAQSSQSVQMTGREIFSERIQKYVYFSTSAIEKRMAQVNKTDANQLNEQIEFPQGQDPQSISWQNGDQICISNTLFAAIFSIFTFSSACATNCTNLCRSG